MSPTGSAACADMRAALAAAGWPDYETANREKWADVLYDNVMHFNPDLVVLAGFMMTMAGVGACIDKAACWAAYRDALRARAEQSAPRLRAAYLQTIQSYAAGLGPGSLPNVDYIAQALVPPPEI